MASASRVQDITMSEKATPAGSDLTPRDERSTEALMDGMKQGARDMLDGDVDTDTDTIRETVGELRERSSENGKS